MNLSVHITQANFIQINQREGADPRARERFDHPGTHTTEPDHTDMRRANPRQASRAIQAPYRTKPCFVIRHILQETDEAN
jgi:hypothetical protein